MKFLKVLLIIAELLFVLGFFFTGFFLMSLNEISAYTMLIFIAIGCSGLFSVYFHIKTFSYYPLDAFDKKIKEISKKYWAMHLAYWSILFLLNCALLFDGLFVIASRFPLQNTIIGFLYMIFGSLAYWETYRLHKFVKEYKLRKQQSKEIETISGVSND